MVKNFKINISKIDSTVFDHACQVLRESAVAAVAI